jgi:hypothetical protein
VRRLPKVKKPKKKAAEQEMKQYQLARKRYNANRQATEELALLRKRLDQQGHAERPGWVVADGNFTNSIVLKNLPPRTVYIGRIRADANLYFTPDPDEKRKGAGRKRSYGDRAPTPAQWLRDESVPWETAMVHAAGNVYTHQYKTLAPLLWRAAGAGRPLRLIAVGPVKYQFRKGQKEHRQPAYLVCTDPQIPVERILQAYYWRWDIEVNFRDEKQLIGVGQAQVHVTASVEIAPAFAIACYALLLAAANRVYGHFGRPDCLPRSAWMKDREGKRATTRELIKQLRFELWVKAIHKNNFSGFGELSADRQKSGKFMPQLFASAINA